MSIMARIVKKRKRLRIEGFAAMFLFVASALSLSSSLFLRTYNNSLSAQHQNISRQIETLRSENEELKTQVQSLSTRDRVTEIAQQEGMAQNQDNVVTIANTGE